jgi:hypothetical protein
MVRAEIGQKKLKAWKEIQVPDKEERSGREGIKEWKYGVREQFQSRREGRRKWTGMTIGRTKNDKAKWEVEGKKIKIQKRARRKIKYVFH